MSQQTLTIPKQPVAKPVEDFFHLRQEGIRFIEQMGSHLWTDYNVHDPGITILEALCYALTDLAYQTGWDIRDILTRPGATPNAPYPNQAFPTAKGILTVNPVTPDDLRRLLIDLPRVRNAWVLPKSCTCDLHYYAWCEKGEMKAAYQKPTDSRLNPVKVSPFGLYEVLLELEADPVLGDLNESKIDLIRFVHDDEQEPHTLTLELRLPDPDALEQAGFRQYVKRGLGGNFTQTITAIKVDKLTRNRNDTDYIVNTKELRRHWREVFFVTFIITLQVIETKEDGSIVESTETLTVPNGALRFFGDTDTRDRTTAPDETAPDGGLNLFDILQDTTENGIFSYFGRKLLAIRSAIDEANEELHVHRNLSEDFDLIRVVEVDEVAVCADIDVQPDADIERVQARIWFEIDNYFNPPVPFYSLTEMMDAEVPVETIFNGPVLTNGFIRPDELTAAGLKKVLRTSDLINRLMDIDGIVAVNQLSLSRYDAQGRIVAGVADPTFANGRAVFDPQKTSAAWVLHITDGHQPRLYVNQSRFLFYKNGLPFRARVGEAWTTLMQLRGELERPKLIDNPVDLAPPIGTFRGAAPYFPVQYSLPATYGVGPTGLSLPASPLRRAQAKQLKAYLTVFEQILANAFAQVSHTADLFSLDPDVKHTYFIHRLTNNAIQYAPEAGPIIEQNVATGLTDGRLQNLVETEVEFQTRRNRFLDHLLARFGEQFGEYALLLTNEKGEKVALEQLIKDKITFLEAYPIMSRNRAKAFDYRKDPVNTLNKPGLHTRISKLLGFTPGADSERFIIVEHLLLRPKFPGDALYPICSDGDCATCGDEDPYSARLTFVMTGWAAPYSSDLELRRFAERTIQAETPAHLLPKICWVGNDGFTPNPRDLIVCELEDLIAQQGRTATNERPLDQDVCDCAHQVFDAYGAVFKTWFDAKTLDHFNPDTLRVTLTAAFQADTNLTPANFSGTTVLGPLWNEIQEGMVDHFTQVALTGGQFERFEDAWKAWLTANNHDWAAERLHERVESLLASHAETPIDPRTGLPRPLTPVQREDLCACATTILAQYGTNFYDWMRQNMDNGLNWLAVNFATFAPDPVTLCSGIPFQTGTDSELNALLRERYEQYAEVSYRLWIVVNRLADLRSVYPGATLHDCDDGSDLNPVRLGSTALGNYPLNPPNH